MINDQSEKRDFRYCPNCHGCLEYRKIKGNNELFTIEKYCSNKPNCSYKIILSSENISSLDRHKLIEKHIGYNESFSLSINEFENNLLPILCFKTINDFLRWLFSDLYKRIGIDHNSLPVASPYPFIIRDLVKFIRYNYQDKFNDEFSKYCKSNNNYSKLISHLSICLSEAEQLIEYQNIINQLGNVNIIKINDSEGDNFEKILAIILNNTYNYKVWQMLFDKFNKTELISITRKIFDYFNTTGITKLKVGIQGLFNLLCPNILNVSDTNVIKLINYFLANTNDVHIPFFTSNYRARNLSEYYLFLKSDEIVKKYLSSNVNQKQSEITKIEKEITEHKNDIDKILKSIELKENIIKSKTESIYRFDSFNEFTGLKPIERLKKIISNNKPIHYFPEILFDKVEEYLTLLSDEEKSSLKEKMKTVPKDKLTDLKIKMDEIK